MDRRLRIVLPHPMDLVHLTGLIPRHIRLLLMEGLHRMDPPHLIDLLLPTDLLHLIGLLPRTRVLHLSRLRADPLHHTVDLTVLRISLRLKQRFVDLLQPTRLIRQGQLHLMEQLRLTERHHRTVHRTVGPALIQQSALTDRLAPMGLLHQRERRLI